MMRCFYLLVLLLGFLQANAQDSIGVIKVSKKKQFIRAVFDNIESTLVAIDKDGIPVTKSVVSFKLYYQEKSGKEDTLISTSYRLSNKMEDVFDQQENMKQIKFIDIVAMNDFGSSETLPDFNEQCGIKTQKKKKRKNRLKNR